MPVCSPSTPYSSFFSLTIPDPDMPHATEVNEVQEVFGRVIDPYMQPGNRIAHDMYDHLELPWAADPAQTAFPKENYQRFDWDRGNVLSDGKDFFGGAYEFPLDVFKYALATVSAVTRWREEHPELVGTERDCVEEMLAHLKQLLGELKLRGGSATVLLIFKKGE